MDVQNVAEQVSQKSIVMPAKVEKQVLQVQEKLGQGSAQRNATSSTCMKLSALLGKLCHMAQECDRWGTDVHEPSGVEDLQLGFQLLWKDHGVIDCSHNPPGFREAL